MALDPDAIKLGQIQRETSFTPFQPGSAAISGIKTGFALEQAKGTLEDEQTKREQAALMQKLLSQGQSGVQAVFDAMPEDQKSNVMGGNVELFQSIVGQAKTPEDLLNAYSILGEAQAAGAEGDFPTQVGAAQKAGVLTAKEGLSLTKPAAGQIKQGIPGEFEVLEALKTFREENEGKNPNKSDALKIVGDVALQLKDQGVRGVSSSDLVTKILTASSLPPREETKLEREKFTFEKSEKVNAAIEKMGNKFDDRTRAVVIAANQLNKSIDGGVFGSKFKNLVDEQFVQGLQERLDLGGNQESMFATLLNSFLTGKVKNIEEAKRVNKVRADPEFQKLFKDPQFNKTFVALSNLVTAVLRKESGAAITSTDIEDKKNNLGFDALGGPGSFLIGIGDFMDGLRSKTTFLVESPGNEEAKTRFRNSLKRNPLVDPFSLPQNRRSTLLKRKAELEAKQ